MYVCLYSLTGCNAAKNTCQYKTKSYKLNQTSANN